MGLAAGVHGIWDGGMDGYALLKAIETVPERGQLLRVTMTCSGATGDPGGSNTVLSLMLSPDVSPAANEGYKGSGFIRSGTPNNKVSKVGKISAGISNDAVLVGTLKASFDVPWGASAPLGICSHVFGSTSGEHWSHKSDGNSGSWGAPCVGVAMENVNSSGGAEVVWSDVVITIEVID
tara:strand:+ start:55 stop:591 length:537 start_codon:yes stop_codon:yes gene_type:complete